MLKALLTVVRALLYLAVVVTAFPLLMLFRVDQPRPLTEDDGISLGYDDDDLGHDVDE